MTTLSSMDRIVERRWPRRLIVAAAVAVLTLAGLLTVAVRGTDTTVSVSRSEIEVAAVAREPFDDTLRVRASVVPSETVVLDVERGGRVEEVLVEDGEIVVAGQPIVRLSNTDLQLRVMTSEAELAEQVGRLGDTRLAYENRVVALEERLLTIDYRIDRLERRTDQQERLSAEGLTADEELRLARDDLREAVDLRRLVDRQHSAAERQRHDQVAMLSASVDRLEANLQMARAALEALTVRAPVGGRLTAFDLDPGLSLAPGARLGEVVSVDAFRLVAEIDEFHLARTSVGLRGEADAPSGAVGVELTSIRPQVEGGIFRVALDFRGEPGALRSGQTMTVRLRLGRSREALTLPLGGFVQATGGRWVFVIDASGRAERRDIRPGLRNERQLEIAEGLVEGERVIVSNVARFAGVESLRIVDDE